MAAPVSIYMQPPLCKEAALELEHRITMHFMRT